jgi:ABC-type dipeptide/oligopeptide/nickel transport system permease component
MESTLATAAMLGVLILVASMASVKLAVSIAIIEIVLGIFAGNVLGLETTEWIDFLAAFGSILLTFDTDYAIFRCVALPVDVARSWDLPQACEWTSRAGVRRAFNHESAENLTERLVAITESRELLS